MDDYNSKIHDDLYMIFEFTCHYIAKKKNSQNSKTDLEVPKKKKFHRN